MIKHAIILLLSSLLLGSCAQLTPFHSARTEGKGNLTFTPAVDGTVYVPSGSFANLTGLPGARLEMAYGITDRIDIIASVYSAGSLKGNLKFQVMGNNDSYFACALMPGYEIQTNAFPTTPDETKTIKRIHLPVLFSIQGIEGMDYYLGPKFAYQIEKNDGITLFSGIVGGVEYGKKRVKYNLGIGAFLPSTQNATISGSLFQFGGSIRIPLIKRD